MYTPLSLWSFLNFFIGGVVGSTVLARVSGGGAAEYGQALPRGGLVAVEVGGTLLCKRSFRFAA